MRNRKSRKGEIWETIKIDPRDTLVISDDSFVPCLSKRLLLAVTKIRYNYSYSRRVVNELNSISVSEIDTGVPRFELEHNEPIRSYKVSLDENILVSATDNRLYFWSLISGNLLYVLKFQEKIESFELAKEGGYVVAQTATYMRIIPFGIDEIISKNFVPF